MPRILLIGTYGSLNKGDEARLRSLVDNVRKITPNVSFSLMSYDPVADRKIYGGEIDIVETPWKNRTRRTPLHRVLPSVIILIACCILHGISGRIPVKILSEYDIILDASGESLSDYFGQRALLSCLFPVILCMLMRKSIILSAQSIGPFEKRFTRLLARLVLARASLVSVRDFESLQYTQQYTRSNVLLTADPAFLLEGAPPARAQEILRKEGVDRDDPIIGISIGYGSFKRTTGQTFGLDKAHHELVRIVARAVDYLQERLGATIILLPHVFIPSENDEVVLKEVYLRAQRSAKVKLFAGSYTPGELKSIIGQCELVVASRLHPIIHALSGHVVPIAIGYSHKMRSIMREFGLEEYAFSAHDLTYDQLVRVIDDAWKNRNAIKERLPSKLVEVRRRALLNVQAIVSLLPRPRLGIQGDCPDE